MTLLASRLAGPLTGDIKKASELYQLHRVQLSDAKAVNGHIGKDAPPYVILIDEMNRANLARVSSEKGEGICRCEDGLRKPGLRQSILRYIFV